MDARRLPARRSASVPGTRRAWIVSAVGTLALAACGRDQVLVVFSELEPELLNWAESAFEASHPAVDLRWVRLSTDETLHRLRGRPGDPEGDVWWGAPSWALAQATDEGLLAAVSPSWAAAVPESMKDAEGRWTGSLVDPLVLAFDREQVSRSRAPRTWDDLRHFRWMGEVVAPDPQTTVTGTLFLVSRVAAATGDANAGFDWLRRFDSSVLEYVENEELLLVRLRRGLGSVALLRLSTAERAWISEGAPDYRVPDSPTPVLVEGIAGLAGAQGEAVAAFMEWSGSAEVSKVLATRFARIPARTDVDPTVFPARLSEAAGNVRPVVIPADSVAKHLPGWIDRWKEEVRGRAPRIF
jgi:iron(III) transport system substrate-binding protein